jgi:transmembrane sensor
MATSDLNPALNSQIYEQASDWLVELRVGDIDVAARQRFDAWLRTSPEHIRAYLELSSIWEDGGDPKLDRNNRTDMLIAQARAATNVIPLDLRAEPRPLSVSPPIVSDAKTGVSRPRFFAAAAVVVVCFGAAASAWIYGWGNATYATGIGEQKLIQLADGSTLELNSRSRARVHFSETERAVDLLEGQALFHVAKDHARPFIVASDGTQVRAVGTQFDVYQKHGGTIVTVVEGRVAILREGLARSGASEGSSSGSATPDIPTRTDFDTPSSSAIFLSAGEQLTVTPKTEQKTAHPNVAAATAWTQRRLVFASTPLTDVAQEFNRYNVRQLVVINADLEQFHVSGVFASTDPTSLLRFLRAQQGIRVDETGTEIRISRE